MRQDSSPFRAVKDAVSVADVASRYTTLEPFGSGGWFTGRCPIPGHEDRSPSFYTIPPDSRYPHEHAHCFGCGFNGDAIDLEQACGDHAESWTAMIQLSYDFGVELPSRPASWYARQERQKPVRDALGRVQADVLRRRVFRWCILPVIDASTPDPTERREEVRRAWEEWARVPDGVLLERGGRSRADAA